MISEKEFREKLKDVDDNEMRRVMDFWLKDGVEIDITPTAQAILKSFMKINRSIVFLPDETSTMDSEERIFAICKSFSMPMMFALTNLGKLLNSLKWVKTERIVLYQDHILVNEMDEHNDVREMKIHFHDNIDLIDSPAKCYEEKGVYDILELLQISPDFSDAEVSFDLNSSDINDIINANRNLDGKENPIVFNFNNNKMTVNVHDEGDTAGDLCRIDRPIEYEQEEFELIYYTADMMFIEGDYRVHAYERGLAIFQLKPIVVEDKEIDLQLFYIIATGTNE
jgi:hypothetical protein